MNPKQFQALALAEIDAVHRLAYHLCRCRHDAEDVVQETYARALAVATTFAPGDYGIRRWLFKILHNTLHTRRGRERRDRDFLSALPVAKAASTQGRQCSPGSGPAAPTEIRWDALDGRLAGAMRELPRMHLEVFLLSAVEQFKYREIAEIVGVPIGTVISRLRRARQALQRRLANPNADHETQRAGGSAPGDSGNGNKGVARRHGEVNPAVTAVASVGVGPGLTAARRGIYDL